MDTIKLRDLPVGATFIRHDEYGDGKTLYVKLAGKSKRPVDVDVEIYYCGSTTYGADGHLDGDIDVQEVRVGDLLQPIAFAVASAAKNWRASQE